MKKIEETVHVPAKTYIRTKYVASDGEEFCSEYECVRHEQKLEIDNHPVFKTCILNIEVFDTDYTGTLYYLSNKEDYNFFIKIMKINSMNLIQDFSRYGAGWYLYWYSNDDGYYYGDHNLYNYNKYVNKIKSELAKWEEDINNKINKGH